MLVLVDSSCGVEALRSTGERAVRDAVHAWLREQRIAVCAPVLAEALRKRRKPDVRRFGRSFEALRCLRTFD